ncbi:MAG: cytochrome c3 family protein [Bryobacterales bacterium]|nr:cytochrome c3 family protein [Bryobacterales bacterium]
MKWNCTQCHTGAEKAERAGFPTAASCTVCHAHAGWSAPSIPSRRVYRQPDFVVFSHARHVSAGKVECATCHGDVNRTDRVALEVEHTMKTCMACHAQRKASNACNVCHELGQ